MDLGVHFRSRLKAAETAAFKKRDPARAPCGSATAGSRPSHLPPLMTDIKVTLESGARLLDGRLKRKDFVSSEQRHHSGDNKELRRKRM